MHSRMSPAVARPRPRGWPAVTPTTCLALGLALAPAAVDQAGAQTPTETTLSAVKDSFLRSGSADRNEGADPGLRIQASGNNRVVVGFDPAAIDAFLDANTLTAATLVLTIAENANNWGPNNDRTVDARPLSVDFAEGNGQNAGVPGAQSTRGSGPGVAWNCATDAEIANQATDCDPRWNGGTFDRLQAAHRLDANVGVLVAEVAERGGGDPAHGRVRVLGHQRAENLERRPVLPPGELADRTEPFTLGLRGQLLIGR